MIYPSVFHYSKFSATPPPNLSSSSWPLQPYFFVFDKIGLKPVQTDPSGFWASFTGLPSELALNLSSLSVQLGYFSSQSPASCFPGIGTAHLVHAGAKLRSVAPPPTKPMCRMVIAITPSSPLKFQVDFSFIFSRLRHQALEHSRVDSPAMARSSSASSLNSSSLISSSESTPISTPTSLLKCFPSSSSLRQPCYCCSLPHRTSREFQV